MVFPFMLVFSESTLQYTEPNPVNIIFSVNERIAMLTIFIGCSQNFNQSGPGLLFFVDSKGMWKQVSPT